MFKKIAVASAVAAALGSGIAQAQTPPASPHTISANVGLYSQYIFRGLTQTDGDPALQGGADYSHSSGFYAGFWASNIEWTKNNNFGAPGSYIDGGDVEIDFYGGYKWGFAPDWTLDLGTLYYYYPGDVVPGFAKADAWEIYAGLSWKWLSAKYFYAVNNKNFQFTNSDGSWYLDLSANVPLGDFWKPATGFTVVAHWGKQEFKGNTGAFSNDICSYADTDKASNLCYGNVGQGGPYSGKNIAKGTGTVFIMKTF